MKPRYSVVVPVYNAEKTLARCVDSLLSQDYIQCQIILVNDGSRDGSGVICREYAEKWDRIVYLAKENGGVSSARNAGLDVAEGEYVTFVDSDDVVSLSYFTEMDAILAEHPVDLVMFSYATTDGNSINQIVRQSYASQDKDDYFCKLGVEIYTKGINSPWGKVYRADRIREKGIRFQEGISIAEDRLFNIAYALGCESLYISEKVLYTVSVENENSLSRKVREDLTQQFQLYDKALEQILDLADLEDVHLQQVQSALNFSQVRSIYSGAKRLHRAGASMRERRKYILEACGKINEKKLSIPNSRYCRLLYLPIRLKMVTVIDTMARRLAK